MLCGKWLDIIYLTDLREVGLELPVFEATADGM